MEVAISRCTADEIADVRQFIDEHWEPGHALATSLPLLDWQHRDADGRGYSFILARRRRDRAVVGILGYIPTRRFDPALAEDNVIWLTMWKVRDDAGVAGLGLALLQFLTGAEPHLAIGAIGLNPATTPIYAALGYRVGQLEHYVYPHAAVDALGIVPRRPRQPAFWGPALPEIEFRRLSEDELRTVRLVPGDAVPRKTPEYFRARYACHPIYRYVVAALSDADRSAALIAARTAEYPGGRALRIVDFFGSTDALAASGAAIQRLLEQTDAAYADIYNVGVEPALLERAGFRRVDPDGSEIVPDHFEPFEARNVRLWYALKGTPSPMLFKGDADQDRPNLVPRPTV